MSGCAVLGWVRVVIWRQVILCYAGYSDVAFLSVVLCHPGIVKASWGLQNQKKVTAYFSWE